MTPLTKSILASIAEESSDAILAAEETICAYLHPNVELIEPYKSQLEKHPPTKQDVEAIKEALLTYVANDKNQAHAAAAFFALGKLHDLELLTVFRTHLERQTRELLKANATLGNLICALDNLREPIISDQAFSTLNIEKNVADARRYLYKHGIVVRH